MIKRSWKIILLVVIILLVAGGIYYKFINNQSSQQAARQQRVNPAMLVKVEKGTIEKVVAGTGYLAPIEEKNLSFPTRSGSTKINRIYVKEGDRVEKDHLLMELDKTAAKLNYIKTQNTYNRAKINGSSTEIEEARLNMVMAGEELENMEMKAPFDGIVTEISVEEGGYYSSGTAAQIIDNSRLQVDIAIEESDIPSVNVGQLARITLNSLPGKVIGGEVVEIADQAVSSNNMVTLPVTVLLEKIDYDLKLGCSADLEIIVGQEKDQLVVPITAIISRNGRDMVMKEENGKLVPMPVKTGLSDGLRIAVRSGLNEGDQILLNTYQQAASAQSGQRNGGFIPGAFGGMRGGH